MKHGVVQCQRPWTRLVGGDNLLGTSLRHSSPSSLGFLVPALLEGSVERMPWSRRFSAFAVSFPALEPSYPAAGRSSLPTLGMCRGREQVESISDIYLGGQNRTGRTRDILVWGLGLPLLIPMPWAYERFRFFSSLCSNDE